MRHAVGAGIFVAGMTLALACAPSTSPLDLAGNYALTSVNGMPLPYLLPGSSAGVRVELLEASFTLNPGGTYSETGYRRTTTSTGVTLAFPVDAGNFRRSGENLTLESLIFPKRMATISNGVLTVVDQQLTLIYRKA
jgi:hypothetical protein